MNRAHFLQHWSRALQTIWRTSELGRNVPTTHLWFSTSAPKIQPEITPVRATPSLTLPTLHTPESTVVAEYHRLMSERALEANNSQVELVNKLQTLQKSLVECDSAGILTQRLKDGRRELGKKASLMSQPSEDNLIGSLFSNLLGKWGQRSAAAAAAEISTKSELVALSQTPYSQPPHLKSLYIWGGVGQGKTMLMDAFYESTQIRQKARAHFHNFILDVQQQLHQLHMERQPKPDNSHLRSQQRMGRESEKSGENWDPLLEVAYNTASNSRLLCIDEFQVVHIADAMILKRLFEGLLHVRRRLLRVLSLGLVILLAY